MENAASEDARPRPTESIDSGVSGKIAVVQVSSGASCNAVLPSTRRRIPLRGPTPRNRWPDFSPENRLAGRYACPELPPPEGFAAEALQECREQVGQSLLSFFNVPLARFPTTCCHDSRLR